MNAALEGLKVADFSWVAVAPMATAILAQYGAAVVRIESAKRLDILRASHPFKDRVNSPDSAGTFATYNANKMSISLDLGHPKGIEIAKRLIKWSDVMIDNFRPGTMAKWGLDYEQARQINPQIIAISSSALGQTGPGAKQPGYGNVLGAFCGLNSITGWPDRGIVNLYGAIPDFIAGMLIGSAILTGLDYRRRTGEGIFIDLAQAEAGLQFMTPAVLDYKVNNRVAGLTGNQCSYASPHGAYRCLGEERWCVIAVFNDAEWAAFGNALGNPGWAQDTRFAAFSDRKKNETELDRLIEAWTLGLTAEEVELQLQSAGVEAVAVRDSRDLMNDPQLQHRGHFVWHDHPVIGRYFYYQPGFRLSETPCRHYSASPCLGQHTEYVCREILHMPDEEFIELMNEVFFPVDT